MLKLLLITLYLNFFINTTNSITFFIVNFSITTKLQLIILFLIIIIFLKKNYYYYFFFKKIKIFILKKILNKTLLFNKIALIHIFFFLITLIFFIKFFLFWKLNSNRLLLSILFFNFLGVYWSLQENLWGGFWNWDLVEISLLFSIIIIILINHLKIYINYFINLTLLIILLYLFYNHLPFNLNLHNFTENKLTRYALISIMLFYSLYFNNLIKLYINFIGFLWFLQLFQLNLILNNIFIFINTLLFFILFLKKKFNWLLYIQPLNPLIILLIKLITVTNLSKLNSMLFFVHKVCYIYIGFIYLAQINYFFVYKNKCNCFYFYNFKSGYFITNSGCFFYKNKLAFIRIIKPLINNSKLLIYL